MSVAAAGEALLDLLGRQGIRVVHEVFIGRAMGAGKPSVERIARVVVLITLDAPMAHRRLIPPTLHAQTDLRPSRSRAVVLGPTGSLVAPKADNPIGGQAR